MSAVTRSMIRSCGGVVYFGCVSSALFLTSNMMMKKKEIEGKICVHVLMVKLTSFAGSVFDDLRCLSMPPMF